MRIPRPLFYFLMLILKGLSLFGQHQQAQDEKEYYYLGINPVAPFTSIRSGFTSDHLPLFSNMETGISIFGGKVWGDTYNVETRLSFGSPQSRYQLFQVHSGFQFCFPSHYRQWNPYAGLFFRLYSLHNLDQLPDYVNTGLYASVGNRFNWSPFFIDLRIQQYFAGWSWSSQRGAKAVFDFEPGIYGWKSAYVPMLSLGAGFYFR